MTDSERNGGSSAPRSGPRPATAGAGGPSEGRLRRLVFRRFLAFLRPHWRLALLGAVLMLVSVALQLPMPLLTMYLVDHVIPQRAVATLNWIGLGLAVFLFLKAGSAHWQNLILAGFRNRVIWDVNRRLFLHLEHLPLTFFERHRSGYLTSRVTHDVNQLQGLMATTLVTAVTESMTFLVGIGLVFWINWKLALVAVLILPGYVVWLARWNPRVRTLRRESQESYARVTGDMLETFTGMYLVKSFLAERRELVKMLRSLKRSLGNEYAADRATSLLTIGATSLSALGKLSLIWFGCWQIMTGDLTLGGFLAFNSFLRYLFDPANNLVSVNANVQRSLAAVDRIFELLDQRPEIYRPAAGRHLGRARGRVEFRDVSFSYDGAQQVLSGIDLRIEPGQRVALVGPSGAGKSTLVKLLMNLYPVVHGSIHLDGMDIRGLDLRWLREQIALVPQDTFLFSGDVWSNLRYGNPKASREQMVRAAQLANADEFLIRLPDQYATEIGERAVRLSGGQRQRLSIAIAFLKDAPILVLDEATSSVDTISEHAIQQALSRLMERRTTFVIAHRLNTVRSADLIVVIDRGRIVETGTHDDLVRGGGSYYRLYLQSLAA